MKSTAFARNKRLLLVTCLLALLHVTPVYNQEISNEMHDEIDASAASGRNSFGKKLKEKILRPAHRPEANPMYESAATGSATGSATDTATSNSLIPDFTIHYRVTFNGIPTGIDATASLERKEDQYQVALQAKSWLLSYHEQSTFHWQDSNNCLLQSENYQFDFEGFKHKTNFEVAMNAKTATAESRWENGNSTYAIPFDVSDALAYLFKLQCDLRAGNLNPAYQIAYQHGIDTYIFEYQGVESIRTAVGRLETLVLKRIYPSDRQQTIYWIAPSLDYIMVRMRHREGKIVTATLNVKALDYKDFNTSAD